MEIAILLTQESLKRFVVENQQVVNTFKIIFLFPFVESLRSIVFFVSCQEAISDGVIRGGGEREREKEIVSTLA